MDKGLYPTILVSVDSDWLVPVWSSQFSLYYSVYTGQLIFIAVNSLQS